MPVRLLSIAVILFLAFPVWAGVHHIPYNVSTQVDLKDGDEILLDNMPMEWGFNKIFLGVNSVPAKPLLGRFVVDGCAHDLHDFYTQFDFSPSHAISIKYFGPVQSLPIHWWTDVGIAFSPCDEEVVLSREDSIRISIKKYVDSTYAKKISSYRDLGSINEESFHEGSSAKYKITKLPNWFYNRLHVLVEPVDGRELDGFAYSGATKTEISGWSAKFVINQKTAYAPTFELAFPEYRKIKIKWWAEVEAPREDSVQVNVIGVGRDSVMATYTFGYSPYTDKTLKLLFNKKIFKDGNPPVVKKLSFNPQGPNRTDDLGVRGDIYDIKAKLNPGEVVVLAIPLDFEYQSDRDSVTIEHFIESENRWVEEPVDSVVGNYAYFKTSHFSWFRSLCRVFGATFTFSHIPALAVCPFFSSECQKLTNKMVNSSADLEEYILTGEAVGDAVDGIASVLDYIEYLACEGIKSLFTTEKKSEDLEWSIDQGKIEGEMLKKYGQDVIAGLKSLRTRPLQPLATITEPYEPCGGTLESCQWERTRENLDIILADAILAQMNSGTEKSSDYDGDLGKRFYKFNGKIKKSTASISIEAFFVDVNKKKYNYADYFMTSSGMIEDAAEFVDGINACYDGFNLSGRYIQHYVDLYRSVWNGSLTGTCKSFFNLFGFGDAAHIKDIPSCALFSADYILSDNKITDSHEEKLTRISEAMVRISLLAWITKTSFRTFALLAYKSAYDGVRAWLDLEAPFLDYNNIPIKAYGSLSLFEFIYYGTEDNLEMVNGGLNHHYFDNGGYSSGIGYSQYIWDDLTYVLATMKDAYTVKGRNLDINGYFLKSPDYMFDFSRPVGVVGNPYGLIPVEVDDGVTYNPDYRVWAKIKNDPKYLAMGVRYPLREADGKVNPLVPFGFPSQNMYNSIVMDNGTYSSDKVDGLLPARGSLWGAFKDGIGIISAVNGDDTVSLSMIAEHGKIWEYGQAHDQQDNLSITLASSKKGFIIQDRWYPGFGDRGKNDGFHRYNDHNVLTYIAGDGQPDNKVIPFDELWSRAYNFTEDFPGIVISALLEGYELATDIKSLFTDLDYDIRVEGGYAAHVLDKNVNKPETGVIGYTAQSNIDGSANTPTTNNRTILYFGGSFWVIDRPNALGTRWLANSPTEAWDKTGVKLYGSSLTALDGGAGSGNMLKQHGARSDFNYVASDYYLPNYSYSLYDANAKTYVMMYPVAGGEFLKTNDNCPKDYQCFENASAGKRLVVPPYGRKFDICDAVPKEECNPGFKSTGITMMQKVDAGTWNIISVLDGILTEHHDIEILSASVSKIGYIYTMQDGSTTSGKYKSAYLPAIPILLLR